MAVSKAQIKSPVQIVKKIEKNISSSEINHDMIRQAEVLISSVQSDLGVELSDAERRDLLTNNKETWSPEQISAIAKYISESREILQKQTYAEPTAPAPVPVIPTISGQIIVCWDGVSLRCEAPGRNGSRQKIEIPFSALPFEFRENLISQIEVARDRAKARLMKMQRNNVQYVAESQPQGIAFAKKIWGTDHLTSKRLERRLAKAGQFDPNLGRIKETDTKKKIKEILDLGDL